MASLSEVETEGRYVVTGLEGGEAEERRLRRMGFGVGMTLEVLASPAPGMVAVRIAGGRI